MRRSRVGDGSRSTASAGGGGQQPQSRAIYGYLVMKCQEVLRQASRPLLTGEMLLSLSTDAKDYNEADLLAMLRSAPQVSYDAATRKWYYRSPIGALNSAAALKALLRDGMEFANGLEVSADLVTQQPMLEVWIKELIATRQIRFVRATKTVRCKNYSAESGIQCDMYESGKCDACSSLKGTIAYGLESEYLESLKVDEDIKSVWADMPLPQMDTILQEHNISPIGLATVGATSRRKKRNSTAAANKRARVGKIQNTHIYSQDDFRNEVIQQQESSL
eukprot:Lankesteria_metandrocarpae@DN10699_c0_g1_i1.p1